MIARPHTTRHLHPQRRGSVYLLVLASSALVTVIGVGTALALRAQKSAIDSQFDAVKARILAQSAVELQLQQAQNTATWRASASAGTVLPRTAVAGGAATAAAEDPTGVAVSAASTAQIALIGVGESAKASQSVRMIFDPVFTALSSTSYPLCVGGITTFDSMTVNGDGPAMSNDNTTAKSNAVVNIAVQSAKTVSGSTFNSTKASNAAAAVMPVSATVFTYYSTLGTKVTLGGDLSINKKLISAAANPFGVSNDPAGIYVIDCKSRKLNITNCRILGTLVVLDPKSGSSIGNAICWETADPAMPALLVRGDLTFATTASDLSEASANVNFNPAGAPYMGVTNATQTDFYTSIIGGLVYISGNLDTSGSGAITIEGGLLVGGYAYFKDTSLTLRATLGSRTFEAFRTNSGFAWTPATASRVVH